MLGLNLEQIAKSEIAKAEAKLKTLDVDHDGIPDLAEAEKLAGEGIATLRELETKLAPSDIAKALNLLFPGKFSADEIALAEASVEKVINAIEHAAGVAKSAGVAL